MKGTQSYGSGGFRIAAQSMGREEGFTVWQKLSFFRADTLAAVLVVLALWFLVRYLPPRWRVLTVGVLSAGVTLALYAQLRAFQGVGQFISLHMFLVALSWGWHEPKAYASYLHADGLLALAVLGLSVLLAVRLCWHQLRKDRFAPNSEAERRSGTIARSIVMSCLLALILPWVARVRSTPYHGSVMLEALDAYGYEGEVKSGEFAGLSTPELVSRYRELTQVPASRRDPLYWGKAKGCNVLFFVFETLPDRFLPADDSLADLPNLRRLLERSFVGEHHYTTFPRTHEAVFSMLSSWYPSDVTRTLEEQNPDMVVPGIMRTLSGRGYHTAIYSPMRRWNSRDEEMFQAVGVQQQIYPPDALLPPETSKERRAAWQKTRIARDLATMNLLEQDLEQCLAKRQHFAAVFLPQIGHLPYPVPQEGRENDLRKQARAILAIQDAWLGELLQLLEQHQQLEQSIIVIGGDHGIRNREEDPRLVAGMIDEYSFHVPLLIYAPQALQRTTTIPWTTSHIDLTPTVLDLLGVEEGREFEQGAPVWNAALAKRTTYFFADPLFGADGYCGDERCYMWNRMSDSVYAKPNPHFDTSDLVPESSPTHDEVSLSIRQMVGLQQVWVTHFGQAKAIRNHLFDR